MPRLVVKKYMGFERSQHGGFGDPAHEKGFINRHIPCAQRANDALMRR
jgi:hypothetical protein